jgi:hypothetical protein
LVNSQLNAADCQEINLRFRLAGFDGLADLELPPPDARHGRHRYRVFDALVHHMKVPAATQPMPPKHELEVVSVQYGSLL